MFFRLRPVKLLLLTAFLFIALAPVLRAQNNTPGVTTTSIRLGSCSALSGPASLSGNSNPDGRAGLLSSGE